MSQSKLPIISHLYKILWSLKNEGIKNTILKTQKKISEKFTKIIHEYSHKRKLKKILEKHKNKVIMVTPVIVDWNIPLFQRPQHLAMNLAKKGILYFFCTDNWSYDNVNGFEEIVDGCYLTNRFDLVDKITDRKKYYDLYSTDNITDWEFVENRLRKGNGIIYQYIDEISSDISGFEIPKKILKKHFNILKDERCIVIPTATQLEDNVKKYRTKNYKLVSNGVELEHFRQNINYEKYPDEIKQIVDKDKPIVGYFGAFASWFDYELIKKLSNERQDLEILLLGWDYDGSMKKSNLCKLCNVTIMGPIPYDKLPYYAHCFSVATVPFLVNDITKSTSPIKLFEYMAMGKPIVTTDMPECRKYKSVLIGKNHGEFIKKIDEALSLKDNKDYQNILNREAVENSWETKAKEILEVVRKR